ncbi:hypothetical protein ACFLXE_03950 [Chloroflexota bacterium]
MKRFWFCMVKYAAAIVLLAAGGLGLLLAPSVALAEGPPTESMGCSDTVIVDLISGQSNTAFIGIGIGIAILALALFIISRKTPRRAKRKRAS